MIDTTVAAKKAKEKVGVRTSANVIEKG